MASSRSPGPTGAELMGLGALLAGAVVAPQLPQDLEAVDRGQADVEDDEVVVLFGAGAQRELSGRGVVDRIARLLQRAREAVGQRLVVFYDEYSHAVL